MDSEIERALTEVKQFSTHLIDTPFYEWLTGSAAMLRLITQKNPRSSDWPYPGGRDEFLIRHGRYFIPVPWPADQKRGPKNECFKNTIDFMAEWEGTYYCEGYAQTNRIIPLHHAWLVNTDGQVFDPTWEEKEEMVYFGVVVSSRWLWSMVLKNQFNTLLDDWRNTWQLYSGKLSPAEILEPHFHE